MLISSSVPGNSLMIEFASVSTEDVSLSPAATTSATGANIKVTNRIRVCIFFKIVFTCILWPISITCIGRQDHYFGTTEALWMGLQADFDLEEACNELGKRLETEVSVHAA